MQHRHSSTCITNLFKQNRSIAQESAWIPIATGRRREDESSTYGLFNPDDRGIYEILPMFLELLCISSLSLLFEIFCEWEEQNHGLDWLRDRIQRLPAEGGVWSSTGRDGGRLNDSPHHPVHRCPQTGLGL